MAAVWSTAMPPGTKLVALALGDMADDEGLCWPAVSTICRKTGQSERTVQGAIRELEHCGALARTKRPHQSTLYRLTPADFAPRSSCTPQNLPVTPATSATPPPQELPLTPAESAPRIIKETPSETPKEPLAPRRQAARSRLNGYRISYDWNTHRFTGIGDEELMAWQEAHPAISVPDQLERAGLWLKANPTKRKSNYERFILNWLSRAQDRGAPIK